MKDETNGKRSIEDAPNDLFKYAVDREDLKALLALFPNESAEVRSKVEYELQILKFIGVGWSISYFLQDSPFKDQIAGEYWTAVHGLSQSISSSAGLLVGKEIDYFRELRDRLDLYINALAKQPEAPEPAVIIGPEFAKLCGSADDIHTVMAGSKMFIVLLAAVKEYLEMIELIGGTPSRGAPH
ncbi:MAG: hypothetical protein AB9873_02235 [Syntrophobacteraceae bacterium]